MEHPFLSSVDITENSLEQLQDKLSDLNNKLTFAYRTNNGPLIHQLHMVLESYRNAYNKKMDELISKQKINTKIDIQKK
jgi:hypothetical protein